MSDDLISRGKAIENLHKIPKIWNGNECLVSFQTVIDYMNSQRIAYDVDKIVEKLENSKTNFIGMGTLQSAYFDKGIDKAIEIVKSGGVSDD